MGPKNGIRRSQEESHRLEEMVTKREGWDDEDINLSSIGGKASPSDGVAWEILKGVAEKG